MELNGDYKVDTMEKEEVCGDCNDEKSLGERRSKRAHEIKPFEVGQHVQVNFGDRSHQGFVLQADPIVSTVKCEYRVVFEDGECGSLLGFTVLKAQFALR